MAITIPNTFSAGTTIVSAQMNENFAEIAENALDKGGDTITGNITVSNGVTIDGVDIGASLNQALLTTSSPTFAALTTTGDVVAGDQLKERGRSAAVGEWTEVAHSGGNFTAASGTWTVDLADQLTFAYTLIGKTMIVRLHVENTDVSTTPSYLAVAIPGGFTAAENHMTLGWSDNAGSPLITKVFVEDGGTIIKLQGFSGGNWTATSSDNTDVHVTLAFEVE